MNFFVRAVWDEGAGVFRSESDIIGLHIETDTIGEFREVLLDMAPELILTNHISGDDLLARLRCHEISRAAIRPMGY